MELAADIEGRLRKLDTATSVEVRENGARLGTVKPSSWQLRGASAKPVLAVHSEQLDVTYRIVGVFAEEDGRLALSFERFGNARPGRVEFLRIDFAKSPRKTSRLDFRARLARVLSEYFPDEALESNLSVGPDLEHSISGNYVRGVMRGAARWAVLAAGGSETVATSANALTFGLLWLARVRETAREGFVGGLRLIVAKGTGGKLVHLAKALSSSIALEIYEFDSHDETLLRVDLNALANLSAWLVAPRERQALLDRASADLNAIVEMAPRAAVHQSGAPEAISFHPDPQNAEIILRFRGLAFARWQDGVIFFGNASAPWKKLTAYSQAELRAELHKLEVHRHSQASDLRHALYRAQPERWLEAVVCDDVTRIDARLDSRYVYTQLFASSAVERGILDVLTVTTSGRLAIIELKASEHMHLPLQAADYWLRIRQHLNHDDFTRLGYFPGIELQKTPPLVYLVAPALRFHSTTGLLLRHLSQSIEVACVGVVESWRRGLRVVMRQ